MSECITHHSACDCKEYYISRLIDELEKGLGDTRTSLMERETGAGALGIRMIRKKHELSINLIKAFKEKYEATRY